MGGTLVSIAMNTTRPQERVQLQLPPQGRIIVWTEQGQVQVQVQAQGITTTPVSVAPAPAAAVAPRRAMSCSHSPARGLQGGVGKLPRRYVKVAVAVVKAIGLLEPVTAKAALVMVMTAVAIAPPLLSHPPTHPTHLDMAAVAAVVAAVVVVARAAAAVIRCP